MGVISIRTAKRANSKVVIGLSGPSGSGKTLSALYVAEGLVGGDTSKIGFLDSENRRGELYCDELSGDFLYAELFPPFTPERYADAIKEFQDAGIEVLVIDSVTHEWEGTGGCIEIAEAAGKLGWNQGKSRHKKFMNVLLQSDMHIIVCVRAREQMDFKNPSKPISLGIQPVQEKNFMFEMTASIMMFEEGKYQQHLKMPKALKAAFGDPNATGGHNGYIGFEQGKAIRDWVESGDSTNKTLDHWKSKMQIATQGGVEELKAEWLKIPKALMKSMKPFYSEFESAAKSFDDIDSTETTTRKLETAMNAEEGEAFNPLEAIKPKPEEPEQDPESPTAEDDQMLHDAQQAQQSDNPESEPDCF